MNIEQRVIATAVELMDIELVSITSSMNLKSDLGMDSLDRLELIMAVEDEFDIEFDDETADSFETIGDIVNNVTKVVE